MRRITDDNGTSGFCLAPDQPFSNRFPLLLIKAEDEHLHLRRALRTLGAFVKGKAD